ncbi:hypothetical protein ABE10_01090, partial [Bacillus toyonensis]|nr:hypothetical protein [Bacillus toyonensis]
LPDVDVELVREHRELVHEGDVDVAERVLQELGELGLPCAGDRHRPLDHRVVEAAYAFERDRIDAGHDLGRLSEPPDLVARVDALGT